MEKKTLSKFLVVLLCLSYVVYVVAVPSTRIPMTKKVDPLVQDHQTKEDLEELFEMNEGFEEGRMMMEITDYPPTGPNHSHTPKTPGKP